MKIISRIFSTAFFLAAILATGWQNAAAQNEFSRRISTFDDATTLINKPDGAADADETSRADNTANIAAAFRDWKAKHSSFPDRAAKFTRANSADKSKSAANFPPIALNDDKDSDDRDAAADRGAGFNYRGAIEQSLMFLGVQHGYAVLAQAKTRRDLKHGAFFRDYANSVKSLHGWDDGGRFFTNYIAHPLQGALTGFIYVQNSPEARREQFSMSPKYWQTRMKTLAWTAAWSTQFEIGPVSQASIGNVGLHGKQTWEDIVVTPTAGTMMLISEDALDRYFVKAIERRTDNLYIKIFARMLLNPTRNFSNMLRFKQPWYRDRPAAN